jgi:hypothetical protein
MRVDSLHSGARLGDVANLLLGFRWEGGGDGPGAALFTTGCAPLTCAPAEPILAGEALWGPPVVTLHAGPEELADGLVPHRIMPFKRDPAGSELPYGALLADAHDAERTRQHLERTTGLALSPDRGFLLLRVRRVSGRAEHEVLAQPARRGFDPALHLTVEGRRRQSCLQTGRLIGEAVRDYPPLSAAIAEGYLRYFHEVGTHFVSAVVSGDQLFQVFSYEREAFVALRRRWQAQGLANEARGLAALAWAELTAPDWIAERGHLVSLAADPALALSVARGDWHDPRSARADSLFRAYAGGLDGGPVFLAPFAHHAPIALELTPISRFLEPERSALFERVLRGALAQRCGGRARIEVPSPDGLAGLLARPPADDPPRATRIFQEHLDLDLGLGLDLAGPRGALDAAAGAEHASREPRCARVLHLDHLHRSGPFAVPDVLAFRVRAAIRSHEAPHLALDAEGRVPVRCAHLAGALWLDRDDGSPDLVMDGLRFTAGPLDVAVGRRRVTLVGDLLAAGTPAPASAAPAIAAALVHCQLPLSARWPDPERTTEAAELADWLASLVSTTDAGLQSLRAEALYTAHVLRGFHADLGAGAGLVPADPEVTAMASAAMALETQELDHLGRVQRLGRDPAGSLRPLWIDHHQRLRHARDVVFAHDRRRIEGQLRRVDDRIAASSRDLAQARADLQSTLDAIAGSLGEPRSGPPLTGPGLGLLLDAAAHRFEDGTPLPPDSPLARALRPRGLRQRISDPELGDLAWVPLAATGLVARANLLDRASRPGEPPEESSAAFEAVRGPQPAPHELAWAEFHERLEALVTRLPAPPAAAADLAAMLAAHRRLCASAPRWLAARLAGSRLRLSLWHRRVPDPLEGYRAELAERDPELAIDQERLRIIAALADALADQDAALEAQRVAPIAGVTPSISSLGRALPWQDTVLTRAAKD